VPTREYVQALILDGETIELARMPRGIWQKEILRLFGALDLDPDYDHKEMRKRR
jgi:hypothetical protein